MQTDRKTDRSTDRQTDRQRDRHAHKGSRAGRQAGSQADRQTDRQTEWQTGQNRPTDKPTHRQTDKTEYEDRQSDRQKDRPIDTYVRPCTGVTICADTCVCTRAVAYAHTRINPHMRRCILKQTETNTLVWKRVHVRGNKYTCIQTNNNTHNHAGLRANTCIPIKQFYTNSH